MFSAESKEFRNIHFRKWNSSFYGNDLKLNDKIEYYSPLTFEIFFSMRHKVYKLACRSPFLVNKYD